MTMNRKKRWLLVCSLTLALLGAGLLLAFLVTKGLRLYCPIQKLTGLLCPGCGNTRATLALLRLDLKAMLKFNLLYPVELLYMARIYYLCCKRFIKTGVFQYHTRPDMADITCLSAILLWTILRNILAI